MNLHPFHPRWSSAALFVTGVFAVVAGLVIRPYLTRPHVGESMTLPSVPPMVSDGGPAKSAKVESPDASPTPVSPPRPRSFAEAAELASVLEQRAHDDGPGTMKLAMAEPNLKMREQLRDAVLRGWAKVDAMAAATWALHQAAVDDRLSGMYPVFEGAAAHDPASAIALTLKLYGDSPDLPPDYANMAITMLGKQGAYNEALQLAIEANRIHSNPNWLNTAFDSWAAYQPAAALKALDRITLPDLQREAFLGLVTGWRSADPIGLATYAATMPPGEQRSTALQAGLLRWVDLDPAAASKWANTLPPGPELDQVAAAVAFVPTLVIGHPDTALSWATSITDPETRANTLRALASQVAVRDVNAARRLLASDLLSNPNDRSAFNEGVHSPPE